jgi:hypothetical protein
MMIEDNHLAILILVAAYLFVLPLFVMDSSAKFTKEYFSCVAWFGLIAVILAGVTVVVFAIFWAIGILLGV